MDLGTFKAEVKKVFPHGGLFTSLSNDPSKSGKPVCWAFCADGIVEHVAYSTTMFPQGPWLYAEKKGDDIVASGFGPTLPEAISNFRAKVQAL